MSDDNVINLDSYRSSLKPGSNSMPVAYFEVLWGESEYGCNAMIVNIEDLRKGRITGDLRPPETSFEVELLIRHIRAVANDLAIEHGMNHLFRFEDSI